MAAARKIIEAENILVELKSLSSGKEFQLGLDNFIKVIHDVFSHLLDEYSKKSDLKIEKIGLEKFRTKAKKLGKIDAINFLIWYEKEYRKIKDDEVCGHLLDRQDDQNFDISNVNNVVAACSMLLNKTRAMAYSAYENF